MRALVSATLHATLQFCISETFWQRQNTACGLYYTVITLVLLNQSLALL